MRTNPSVLRVLSKDATDACGIPGIQAAVNKLSSGFMRTGAFSDVNVQGQGAADGSGNVDLLVGLQERSYTISAGGMQSLSGRLEAVR